MRLYRDFGRRDQFLIEDPNQKGEYLSLENYLKTIPNELERDIERLKLGADFKEYK